MAAAQWFDDRPDVKVVVIAGAGRAFTAGADLAAFGGSAEPPRGGRGDSARAAADAGRAMADAIDAMRAVTVARIHGHCVGGGVVLAAACDLRVAADTTSFSIPEVALGIPLAWGGVPRLVRELGPARTKELVMTCRPFDAHEAHAMGFVNRVVPEADLDVAVAELVAQLVDKSPMTLTMTKHAANSAAAALVSTAAAWSDADALVSALHDPESRRVARDYLARLGRG